ncbi:NAD(P)H-hydrate dehydratase [Vibrio profundi]|uniref:NAD(P)H-hydrate dehydratase n=1 Tax=Vibrio profundi TaxID=1774960 RepID=UPI0037358A56
MDSFFLYSSEKVRQGERVAARLAGVEMYTLMERAGSAVFETIIELYPNIRNILVMCGNGNNGGDGYVVARLAKQKGLTVTLVHVGALAKIEGDARTAFDCWTNAGGSVEEISNPEALKLGKEVDLIVDALLGTGLKGQVRDNLSDIIHKLNQHSAPIISVDVPSGLCADTGTLLGASICATNTVTFIGRKKGLYTGQARQVVGKVHFAGLGVESEFCSSVGSQVHLLDFQSVENLIPIRIPTAHKGNHGRLLSIGGQLGAGGAILLATEAALRSGAGLVCTATHERHLSALLTRTPEAMYCDWDDSTALQSRLNWASAILFGPGLGIESQASALFTQVSELDVPKVFDADGLNLLAKSPRVDNNRVITPHPGEAARLLGCSVPVVEGDRYSAARELRKQYGGVVVLKGAGTLIDNGENTFVCSAGNPGMAVGGMGDVLSGVIASLLAQGLNVRDAALLGTMLHSSAADHCREQDGELGLLASDLFSKIRRLLN